MKMILIFLLTVSFFAHTHTADEHEITEKQAELIENLKNFDLLAKNACSPEQIQNEGKNKPEELRIAFFSACEKSKNPDVVRVRSEFESKKNAVQTIVNNINNLPGYLEAREALATGENRYRESLTKAAEELGLIYENVRPLCGVHYSKKLRENSKRYREKYHAPLVKKVQECRADSKGNEIQECQEAYKKESYLNRCSSLEEEWISARQSLLNQTKVFDFQMNDLQRGVEPFEAEYFLACSQSEEPEVIRAFNAYKRTCVGAMGFSRWVRTFSMYMKQGPDLPNFLAPHIHPQPLPHNSSSNKGVK